MYVFTIYYATEEKKMIDKFGYDGLNAIFEAILNEK